MRLASRAVGSAGGPGRAGRVVHTMGYPLKMEEFGGGFVC
jgi:hypothetical protein